MKKNRLKNIVHAGFALLLVFTSISLSIGPTAARAQAGTCPDGSNPPCSINNTSLSPTYGGPATTQATPAANPNNPSSNNPTPSYTLLEPLPCIPSSTVSCPNGNGNTVSSVTFQSYVQFFFNLVIALSAAAAVFMIAAGGLQYMTTDSWTGKSAGLQRVKNAVIGLIIVLGSYFILQVINPQLVAIPTTLVTPLNINYTNQMNDLLNSATAGDQINGLAADTNAQNVQLQNTIASSQNTVDNDNSTIADTDEKIAEAINPSDPDSVSDADIDAACTSNANSGSTSNSDLSALCTQLNQTYQDLGQAHATITEASAQDLMNSEVQNCLHPTAGTSVPIQTCVSYIGTQGQIYKQQLIDAGQTVQAQQVADSAVYDIALAQINNAVVSNLTSNKNAAQSLQAAENATVAGTVVNAEAGNTGTAAGYLIIGSLVSSSLSGSAAQTQQQQAQQAIDQISSAVNSANISDPNLKAQLVSEATSIAQALGGKLQPNTPSATTPTNTSDYDGLLTPAI